jgi:hypothetical protein
MNKLSVVLAFSLLLTACKSRQDEQSEKASKLLKYAHYYVLQKLRDSDKKIPFATVWRDSDATINVTFSTVCFGQVNIMYYMDGNKVEKLVGYKFSLRNGAILDGAASDARFLAVMNDCAKALRNGVRDKVLASN